MRVLQVTPAFYPSKGYGGGPLVAYEISKRLVKRGFEVTVFTTNADDRFSELDYGVRDMDGIKVYYFKNISNSLAYNHKLFIPLGMMSTMRKEMKHFDIIHAHDFRTYQNILVHHYSRKYDIPYILHPHGAAQRIAKRTVKSVFDLIFGYKILRDANVLIALNKTEYKRYREMGVGEDKIEIVPNGFESSEYNSLPEKGIFRKKHGIGIDEKIIFYLGRIHESKSIDLLVNAFANVAIELDDVKLIIAGPDDGYLSTLNRLITSLKIENKVKYLGFISKAEKLSAYIDADVFVTPTFYGFPLTFLEAWVCGTPIVTTDKGDSIEGIDNKIGYVVQHNKEQLVEALLKLLSDKGLRERFGENAKRLARDCYDWDVIVHRIEQIYKNIFTQATIEKNI
jgi:glycosyltransferase involved in cell wall biosynthesis